jgi:hypothetical protein
MAKTIWKFPIHLEDAVVIDMPVNAKTLCIDVQKNVVYLWAEVDPEVNREKRIFHLYGTGHSLPDDPGTYISSFMVAGGTFVFHVYEDPRGGSNGS